jgi:hypothetical protein
MHHMPTIVCGTPLLGVQPLGGERLATRIGNRWEHTLEQLLVHLRHCVLEWPVQVPEDDRVKSRIKDQSFHGLYAKGIVRIHDSATWFDGLVLLNPQPGGQRQTCTPSGRNSGSPSLPEFYQAVKTADFSRQRVIGICGVGSHITVWACVGVVGL